VTLGEIIELNAKHPQGYDRIQREYKIFEVLAPLHTVRVLAKDELDAYRVYLSGEMK
jgi:hypothetical protein